MRELSAASKWEFENRDSDPEDPGFVGNSEHLANLPNETCDGAALAHKLSVQLQQAEERINQLERERNGFFDQLLAEAKAAIEDAQSKADARLKRTIREGDERVTQVQAEAESEIGRLQNELSQTTREADECGTRLHAAENEIGRLQNELCQATRGMDQLKADADDRVEYVKRETDARVASMENEAKKRIDVIQREHEETVFRLETELAQATNRANRAEQWVMLVHNEIEHRLMPSVTTMRVGPTSTIMAASSGLLAGATVPHSPVRTWFRWLWLQISAAAGWVIALTWK